MKEDFQALFVLHGTTYNSFFWMEPYRSTKRRCSREGRAYLQIRYQLSKSPKCLSFITKEMAPKQLICNPDTSKHGQIDPQKKPKGVSQVEAFEKPYLQRESPIINHSSFKKCSHQCCYSTFSSPISSYLTIRVESGKTNCEDHLLTTSKVTNHPTHN